MAIRGAAFIGAAIALGVIAPRVAGAAGKANIDEICRTVVDDANYKVRVQAALVLGRIGDRAATGCLGRALGDQNKTVRAMAAQALGLIADPAAAPALRPIAKRDPDPFVRQQAERALAAVEGAGASTGGGAAPSRGGRGGKIFVNLGPFAASVKGAPAGAAKLVRDKLEAELGKVSSITLTAPPGGAGSGRAFWVDGNVTRLDDTAVSGSASNETSCGVRVMVAVWPSKSLISMPSAEASVQSGSRPRDKENARRDCLEAIAAQLAEDLAKFLKAQGG